MITHWSKVYALKKSDGRSVATHNEKNTPFDFFFSKMRWDQRSLIHFEKNQNVINLGPSQRT